MQVALVLNIAKKFAPNAKVLYQEMQYGPGEAQFWHRRHGTRVLRGSEAKLGRIPPIAKTKKSTLIYMIGRRLR